MLYGSQVRGEADEGSDVDLLEDGHSDFAASRAYYGCCYTAEALLLLRGLTYS